VRSLALLLVVALLFPLAFAGYVGDGVCDQADLLRRSPDCAPSVYIEPPRYLVFVPSSVAGAILTLDYTVRNPYDLPAYVCFVPAPNLDMNRVCFGVPPNSSTEVSLSFPLYASSYIDVVTSYWAKRISLILVPDWLVVVASKPEYLVSAALFVLALVLLILSRSR